MMILDLSMIYKPALLQRSESPPPEFAHPTVCTPDKARTNPPECNPTLVCASKLQFAPEEKGGGVNGSGGRSFSARSGGLVRALLCLEDPELLN